MTDQNGQADAWQLLSAGGLSRSTEQPDAYSPLEDPRAADRLVRLLAEKVRDADAETVLVWDELDQVVLGHLLAAQLGTAIARAYDAEGLIAIRGGDLPENRRVLIVTDAVRDPHAVIAMREIVEQQGATVSGIAVLVRTDQLREAVAGHPMYALVDWRAGKGS